jgi:hypothetical protein
VPTGKFIDYCAGVGCESGYSAFHYGKWMKAVSIIETIRPV